MPFISLEGIDGCGKTTQWELLRSHLESAGATVVPTREPGGTALAEEVRGYILNSQSPLSPATELLLFGAARAQHVVEVICPALERGDWVLCDRFIDSTLAYQGGGLGLSTRFIGELNAFATAGVQPALTFLFDVDVEDAQARRAAQRGEDRIEKRGLEFQERVRQMYLQIAQDEPQRMIVVDASAPTKVIHNRVVRTLKERELWPQPQN
jgi:dTMP kinase